jgi:tripartite ATP-independent transporter DctP family solute receptor
MTTNTRRRLLLAGAAALAAPAVAGRDAAAQGRVTLRLGHLANEQNVWHRASLKLAEEARTLSNGRVDVQVFPNETLGREMDVINGMQLGTADMTITGESLQNWSPLASLLAVPYAVTSIEQMDAVAGGPIGQRISAEIVSRARVRPLGYFARGPRNLTANRPIRTPDELNGLRLRVPNVPLFVSVWSALGARPTPMAFGEVYTSLQTGVVEAAENGINVYMANKHYEVAPVLSITEHEANNGFIWVSDKAWNGLSDQEKQWVQAAADEVARVQPDRSLKLEKDSAARLEKMGVKVVREVDKSGLIAVAVPIQESLAKELGPHALKILELIRSIK